MRPPIGVKICGLSEPNTLKTALSHGARYVGFVHYPQSPRHISLEALSALAAFVPAHIGRIAVLVDPDQALLQACTKLGVFSHLQIHNVANPAHLAWIKSQTSLPLWQAVSIGGPADFTGLSDYKMLAELLVFDAKPRANGNGSSSTPLPYGNGSSSTPLPYGNGSSSTPLPGGNGSSSTPLPGGNGSSSTPLPGGNGVRFDWRMLQGQNIPMPWMLSGGLDASNLGQAVRITGAHLLDVSSGVEEAPGIKSEQKIAAFLKAAHTL